MTNITGCSTKNLDEKLENTENENACITAEIIQTTTEETVKETDEEIQTINLNNEENDINSESDWQKPISLKGFKKKLNEMFIVKCSLTGCGYCFETDEKRNMHEKCHVSTDVDQVRQFKCLQCGNESKLWRDCTSHMWKEHKIDIDLLKCPFCTFRAVFAGEQDFFLPFIRHSY